MAKLGSTRQQQIEEIIKCGKDPVHFMKHYVFIQHPTRGSIKFDLFKFQEECIQEFLDNRFVVVNKSRQLGLSTLVAGYCLWLALFYKDKNILAVATKMAVAKNFITKVRVMYKSLPSWLILPTLNQDSTQALGFDNGSIIKAAPTNHDVGRSEAISLLVIDEAAHIPNLEELWPGLYNTVSAGGRILMLSTPRGVGNQFHRVWDEAQKRINGFYPIELKWDVHPERNEEWFKKETRGMDSKAIAQELNCSFGSSGDTFLTGEDILWVENTIRQPLERAGKRYEIWIWKYPVSGNKYIISADVCRGDGDDFSAFHIIDMMEDEVVAEFRGKIFPDNFAELLIEYGIKYNKAVICNELNTFGAMCGKKLRDLKYENLYYEKYTKDVYSDNIYSPDEEEEVYPGLTTTGKNRSHILAKFEEIIRNKRIKVYSSRLNDELKTFIFHNNRPQAMRSYNDDLVMSVAIGCWIYEMGEGHSKNSEELNKALFDGCSRVSTTIKGGSYGADFTNTDGSYNLPIIPMSFERRDTKDPRTNRIMPGSTAEKSAQIWANYGWIMEDYYKRKL